MKKILNGGLVHGVVGRSFPTWILLMLFSILYLVIGLTHFFMGHSVSALLMFFILGQTLILGHAYLPVEGMK